MHEVALAFFWHQHQPYYPDDVSGENPIGHGGRVSRLVAGSDRQESRGVVSKDDTEVGHRKCRSTISTSTGKTQYV